MKNNLPEYWVVKCDKSIKFKESVVAYINENSVDFKYKGTVFNSFYGFDGEFKESSLLEFFKNNPQLLSIDEFIELSKPIEEQKQEKMKNLFGEDFIVENITDSQLMVVKEFCDNKHIPYYNNLKDTKERETTALIWCSEIKKSYKFFDFCGNSYNKNIKRIKFSELIQAIEEYKCPLKEGDFIVTTKIGGNNTNSECHKRSYYDIGKTFQIKKIQHIEKIIYAICDGGYCIYIDYVRLATPEEIIEYKKEKDFKAGDYVLVRYTDDHCSGWNFSSGDEKILKISYFKNQEYFFPLKNYTNNSASCKYYVGFEDNSIVFDGKNVDNYILRKATLEEIIKYIELKEDVEIKLPKIYGYEGEYFGTYIKFGCQTVSISTIKELIRLKTTSLICGTTLITEENLKQIAKYIDFKEKNNG